MAIQLNSNIRIAAPAPIDDRYLSSRTIGGSPLPYSANTEVFSTIPFSASTRYTGLTVNINGTEYWFKNGVTDFDLEIKSAGGGTITGATNGIFVTGKNVALGGGDAIYSGGTISYLIHPTFTGDTQLIDKKYADMVSVGVHPKAAVKVATTGNTSPFPPTGLTITIDGVSTFFSGDRVLFKDQTDKTKNGIYSASTGQWGRTNDFDATSGETVQGDLVPVISGNTNKNTLWVLIEPKQYTGFTQNVEFTLFSSITIVAGTGIDVIGSTISLTTPVQNILNVALTGTTGSFIGTSGRNVCINSLAQTILNNAIIDAESGLHKTSGNKVALGGTLTGDTFIETSASCLVLGTAGKQIKIDSSAIVIGEITQVSNFIYTSPTETVIDSGAGNLMVCSTDIVVSGTSFCYAQHPTFSQDTQIVDKKYVDDKASGSTTYQCCSPSTITVGGLPAGSILTGCGLDRILEEILTPFQAPAFSSFSVSGIPLIVEVGYSIPTGATCSFSWTFTNANVQAATMCVRDVTAGVNRATNISISSPQSVAITPVTPITFSTCGQQQSWCGSAKNTNAVQFGSVNYTTIALLPYYYGVCTCPGPAGANRPTATCAMVLGGTKCLASSSGSISITFNSTSDDYLWFAVPATVSKVCWCTPSAPTNNGAIGGGINPACNLFPAPSAVSVTTVCWAGCSYNVYISNAQTSVVIPMALT